MMLSSFKLPQKLRKAVEKELEMGESIQWIEQPIARFFNASSVASVIFGIPWTSFALFWTYGALGFELPQFTDGIQPQHLFALFGVPFILIGFVMLTSPFWAWQAARETVYLITNRRAIAIEGGWVTTIRSYLPHELGHIYRQEKADGTGNIVIIKREWTDSDGDRMTEEIGLMSVRNPRETERILKQLAKRAH